MTKVVRTIFLLNTFFFIVNFFLSVYLIDINSLMALYPFSHKYFELSGFFTYMFSHSGLDHYIMNMLTLIYFGTRIEQKIGTIDFLKLYLFSGLIGGLAHICFNNQPVIGASAALWGILSIFLIYFHSEKVKILEPINISIIISILFLREIILLFENDGVSHLGHVAGALSGLYFYFFNLRTKK